MITRIEYEIEKPYMRRATEHLLSRISGDASLASKWAESPEADPLSFTSIEASLRDFLAPVVDGAGLETELTKWMGALRQAIEAVAEEQSGASEVSKASIARLLAEKFLEIRDSLAI